VRIEEEAAFANLLVPSLLGRSGLADRDRAFVTELVYGTTRMRRACDWVVGQASHRPLDSLGTWVLNALRLGVYQLVFLGSAPHAAVSETVEVAPKSGRGLVNAVLRRVVREGTRSTAWPDDATRLSYPDWVVARLGDDLGRDAALGALEAMNQPAVVHRRADGYVQDPASQWVVGLVGASAGERVADVCAGPGGKATGIARDGAFVVAGDVSRGRAGLVRSNATGLGLGTVAAVVADGRLPPLRAGTFERVLVDAPCSGLGVLRRRPDARWRVRPGDVAALAGLQRELLTAAVDLVRMGGLLVYSVCTLTRDETIGIDEWLAGSHPELEPLPVPGEVWQAHGRGALVLPQSAGTDGMFVLALRRNLAA